MKNEPEYWKDNCRREPMRNKDREITSILKLSKEKYMRVSIKSIST